MSHCDNCHTNDGPHFVPPCVGEPGFFTCTTPEQRHADFRAYYTNNLTRYAEGSQRWHEAKEWLEMNPGEEA